MFDLLPRNLPRRAALGRVLGLLTLWATLAQGPAAFAGQGLADLGIPKGERPVVVELYTSQGCNTCPPADELLGKLAQVPGVLALSFHVDYWDYIGWKDVFAAPAHSERQRLYARALSLRYVYTPQMVVDGRYDVAGFRSRQVYAAIEKAARTQQTVPIEIDLEGGRVRLPAGEAPQDGATVWLVMYDSEHTTDIRRGENAGKKLTYHNVVRDYRQLAIWTGEPLDLPLDLSAAGAREGCAVLLQSGRHGPLLGAAVVGLPGGS